MALFTSYSESNLIIDSPLCVIYSKSRVSGSYVGATLVVSGASATYTEVMEYRRRATKCYRYIAMDYDKAIECRTAMIEKYTRDFKLSVWDATTSDSIGLGTFSDINSGETLMAEVSMERNDDGSWDVIICVNEDDVRLRKIGYTTSYNMLFGTEALGRDYDGEKERSV